MPRSSGPARSESGICLPCGTSCSLRVARAAPIARITIRYVAGYLALKGIIYASTGKALAADADLVWLVDLGLGAGMAAVTEGYYWLAKRYGWKT